MGRDGRPPSRPGRILLRPEVGITLLVRLTRESAWTDDFSNLIKDLAPGHM